jgi:hypothetical protein
MEALKFWATPVVCVLIIGVLITIGVQALVKHVREHVRVDVRWAP